MKSFLFILVAFLGVTSTVSGILMISKPDGSILNLPPGLLEGTPFSDYLLPGIILTVFVGGVNLLAVYFNLERHPGRYNWSIAGGLMICGWIVVQVILINTIHWFHFLYFIIGIMTLLTAYQLKGKWAV
jgi:hypothetical protein